MEAAYGFSITIAMLMTTVLLSYFLVFRLKWDAFLVILILALFTTVELSFFIANVAKIKERWMFLFFELFIFLTMYVWYHAKRVNNKFTRFVDLGKYVPQLLELSDDGEIPKFATHAIYLSKASARHEIEEKIMKSIFSRKPKRADVYWFVHIRHSDQPYTLNYEIEELVNDKVIKLVMHVGFRVQPKTEMFFKQIVRDLVERGELQLIERLDGATRYNAEPDFRFVILEKFLSIENELNVKENFLLKSYFFLKHLAQRDEKAFGLDKSDVVVEHFPLIYHPSTNFKIERKHE